MSDHDLQAERLPLYASGDLAPAERAALEAHLEGCADCRAELAELQEGLDLLGAVAAREDPCPPLEGFFAERLAPALEQREARPRARVGQWVLRAAALFLAFAAGLVADRALSSAPRSALATPSPTSSPPPAPTPTRAAPSESPAPEPDEPRLARAYQASVQGSTSLSRALLAMAALEEER